MIDRVGVFGYNLPARQNAVIQPAQFNIVGAIGRFARGLTSVIPINNTSELVLKTGGPKVGYLGYYVLTSLFQNLQGQPAKIYVKPYVASDAVQATATVVDQSSAATLAISAAYGDGTVSIVDKSFDGNLSGYTINSNFGAGDLGGRFQTTVGTNASLGATSLVLSSVAGLRIGDILKIRSTSLQYTKISAIDANTNTVTCTALTAATVATDPVDTLGFQITCYRKNSNGIVSKVSLPENSIWLSLEPENTEFYVNNAFKNHPYLSLTDSASASSPVQNTYPSSITTPAFLASGSDGTAPSSASDWNLYSAFDIYPVRFLFNTDTTLSGVNIAGEAYCGNRLDTPQWLYNIPAQQSKASYIAIGQSYQRSNQVNGEIVAGWRNVTDPIGVGSNPVLRIPNVGAIVGTWIRAFFTGGVHRSPAGDDFPLIGFLTTSDATENTFTEQDRADLQNAGINIIQDLPGRGTLNRSFITPSTSAAYLFGKWNLLQNFIKISAAESNSAAENRPNRIAALKNIGNAIEDFGERLYDASYPFGIDPANGAFGQFFNPDGTISTFDQVFQVQVDQFNNPNSAITNGEGSIYVFFYPSPDLRKLGIGVGFLIPV
ncbi:hypothetical protein EHQ53_14010 [Leptospira langatensis]|uniref:Uncharacterized protein n=1 Tax=Leptospira langatensis TaxID=2484983 RepID=A0ABY2M970_9LEPT|nr:hypothetical protein [Leptospira langatensis]TGL39632.1 hypothetical protein EHQ53_14010 [Leptospira langatensis]